MSLYLVRMDHPDGEGWNTHLLAHLEYLSQLIDAGKLLASGPLTDSGQRTGFLILSAASREEAEALVNDDPYAREGLITSLRIEAWNPLFGAFADRADGDLPPAIAALFRR